MKNKIRIGSKPILILGALLLLLSPLELSAKIYTPEEYSNKISAYFSDEQWEEGYELLGEALKKYPSVSDLQGLMGKYWYHRKNLDKARYHLIKAVDADYDNLEAKKLLIHVEDVTGNYSSAICYVNELLETDPYSRTLWRRKIALYRKQGNSVEADRLLKRLNQIYPQDSVLRKDFVYMMELNYQRQRRTGDRKQAIATLDDLLKQVPDNEQYYLDMINLYLQEGEREQALGWASAGLAAIPNSTALVYKKVGILGEMSRHAEALTFMRSRMKKDKSPEMYRLYNELLLEAAQGEKLRDPYVLYAMAYENGNKSRETLNYLLNTALARGYNEDALYYIREMKRLYGADKPTLYKEYVLYRDKGERIRASNLLIKLREQYPEDGDLTESVCSIQLQRAAELIGQGLYSEALPCVRYVLALHPEAETERVAWNKVLDCQIGMKRYQEALATLDTFSVYYPDYENEVGKRAFLLDKLGRTPEALQLYGRAIESADPEMRLFYVAGYEEIAVPYIKRCIEAGATKQGFDEAERLLRLNPSNELALRYAINLAAQLGLDDKFREYTEQGITNYPDEPYYVVKKASSLDKEGEYSASIAMVWPMLRKYPGNGELTGALSQSSEYHALELNRQGDPDAAIAVIDTALAYDGNNNSLLYAKGLAYEKKKEYEPAYTFQKFYNPSGEERRIFEQHLKGLRHALYRNEIGLEYLQSRYGDKDAITSIATLEYSRKEVRNTYTGRINYAGRNGTPDEELADLGNEPAESGGVGFQLQAEWVHTFSDETWQGMINAAWADRYFPKVMANIALTKYFPKDWEVELRGGYRRLDSRNLYSVGPGVAKFWGPLWVNAKTDLYVLDSKLYYNAMVQMRYYPVEDNCSYIAGMAGIGSAPELAVLDRALPGSFSHANTMVGLGGKYLLLPNLSVGLLGTWYTYYTEKRTGYDTVLTRYKNLYNIYVQLYISF